MAASLDQIASIQTAALQQLTLLNATLGKIFPRALGSFTLAAAATTTITQPAVTANCQVVLTPTNASAATLMGSAKSLYVSAKVAGTSFTVATASAANAAGTETFAYAIFIPS